MCGCVRKGETAKAAECEGSTVPSSGPISWRVHQLNEIIVAEVFVQAARERIL